MSLQDRTRIAELVAVVEAAYERDESDHAGEGVTARYVSERVDLGHKRTQGKLKQAVEQDRLAERPAVTLHSPGNPKAYVPADAEGDDTEGTNDYY